jgi:hypothetical protein
MRPARGPEISGIAYREPFYVWLIADEKPGPGMPQ